MGDEEELSSFQIWFISLKSLPRRSPCTGTAGAAYGPRDTPGDVIDIGGTKTIFDEGFSTPDQDSSSS